MTVFGVKMVREAWLRRLLTQVATLEHELKEAKGIADGRAGMIARQQEHLVDARGRAVHAEGVVQLQAKSIEQLMASNERMVGLVADMRRVGFGILTPAELEPLEPSSVFDADREAVEGDPDLAADEDL